MEKFSDFWNELLSNKLTASIMVVVVGLVIYWLGYRFFLKRHLPKKANTVLTRRGQTYWRMIASLFRYGLVIVLILAILKVNGVNVDSLIAGLGIAGVVAGLAVQDVLKDMIRGFGLVTDNYFSVGDVIKFGDDECRVVSIGVRTTKLQSTITNNSISIANREIEKAEILKDAAFVVLPTPYDLSLADTEKLINAICEAATMREKVGECTYLGVKQLDDNSINHLIKIHCRADQRCAATRKVIHTALQEYEKHGVAIPYPQMDVHLDPKHTKSS